MKKYNYTLILGFIAFACILFFMPHKPSLVANSTSSGTLVKSNASLGSVEEAVELMKSTNPMAGIQMLKNIVEKDPSNTKALYQLAFFSIQSGQMDKAIDRFNQILAIDSTKSDVLYYMSGIYMEQGKYEQSLKYLELFKGMNKDEKIAQDIDANIVEVKQKINEYAKR